MNRRRFLRASALWLPVAFTIPVRAANPFARPSRVAELTRRPPLLECPSSPSQEATGTDDALYLGGDDTQYYFGQSGFDPGANVSVCRLDFHVWHVTGDISAFTYVAQIWTMSGTSLDAKLGESAGVAGSAITGNSWVEFDFASGVAITNGVSYALVMTHNGFDATNLMDLYYGTGSLSGNASNWRSNKTAANIKAAYDAAIRIYYT